MKVKSLPMLLLVLILLGLIWSGINPRDRLTWMMEVSPAVIGIIILAVTYNRFRFSNLCYILIAIHMSLLMIGGHYTYAQVPFGNWLKETLDLGRNHFDRLGHFAQGFVPAIIVREILLRSSPLRPGKLLSFIVVCICLAFSAGYEFLEWWAAVILGQQADAFLATQGDVWDTQWDMFLAMVGSITALVLLSGLHDRALRRGKS